MVLTGRLAAAAIALVSSALAATLVAQVGVPLAPTASTEEQPAPQDVAGREALEQICSSCHEPARGIAALRTQTDWSMVLEKMVSLGATGTDEQFERVMQYLLRNYTKVEINRARAPELVPVLDVTPVIAEAIVRHRAANGPFKTLDDLRQVPGLDAARLDTRKNRLVF